MRRCQSTRRGDARELVFGTGGDPPLELGAVVAAAGCVRLEPGPGLGAEGRLLVGLPRGSRRGHERADGVQRRADDPHGEVLGGAAVGLGERGSWRRAPGARRPGPAPGARPRRTAASPTRRWGSRRARRPRGSPGTRRRSGSPRSRPCSSRRPARRCRGPRATSARTRRTGRRARRRRSRGGGP